MVNIIKKFLIKNFSLKIFYDIFLCGVKFLTKSWKSIEKKTKKGYNYNRLKFCLNLNYYKMEGKRE